MTRATKKGLLEILGYAVGGMIGGIAIELWKRRS